MTILIKNGRVLNPSENLDKVMDLLVEDGRIKEKKEQIETDADKIIDAKGCYVMPGLIDLHVHFRDPGLTYKEDIETGSRAAANGGFTTVCCMPNTKPVVDNVDTVKYIIEKGKEVGLTNVLPVGAVTMNMEGKEVTDIESLKKAGICAISEDGKSVMNSGVYRKAMKEAARLNVPVMAHCEDINLVEGGVINLGNKSKELGVKGISNAVEDVIAMRDIMLARETNAKLHLCHCSTKDSVEMVKQAKAEGIDVTAEVCPHHFSMCSDDITENDGNFKMNPPLRTREDMETLIKGLSEDIMDVISTDHAPHSKEEKEKDLEHAPFGIVGLETSVPLTITNLVKKGYITPLQMAAKMSYNPAQVLGSDKGTLNEK
ncbi:MAG: dihydroorotase, partial [Eubacterium sp.]|nr:dihydroorotase [Eubacterium sp.]